MTIAQDVGLSETSLDKFVAHSVELLDLILQVSSGNENCKVQE